MGQIRLIGKFPVKSPSRPNRRGARTQESGEGKGEEKDAEGRWTSRVEDGSTVFMDGWKAA
jgi:hypothetical protein